MIRVSLCCSVLNQSDMLKDMIGSVKNQKMKDWELIIVDDGSTHDIAAVVNSFKDQRIRLIKFEKNYGIPYGINRAFQEAKGEYVQAIAADELIAPEKLEIQVKFLDEHPQYAAVWSLPRNGQSGKRPDWEMHNLRASNRSREQWVATFLNLDHVPIGSAGSLFRRTVFDKIGYFDTSLKPFSDHEWWVRFVENFDGWMMPYRLLQCQPNPTAASQNTDPEVVRRELEYVRAQHPMKKNGERGCVTVCIPAKDMAEFITETINSVLAQTYRNFEIVVVNDGSTDNTKEIVSAIKDTRVKLINLPKNGGMENALNEGIKASKSPYFMCLSADDTIEPDLLERAIEAMVEDPLLEFVASQTDFINDSGQPYGHPLDAEGNRTVPEHGFEKIEKASNKTREEWLHRLWYGNVYFGAGIYRTQALRDIGGWRKESWVLSDYEMYLELLQRSNILIIEQPLTHTRIHTKNRSMGLDQDRLRKTYGDIKRRFYQPRMKVIIATPFYESRGFSPYIVSLYHTTKMLTMLGIENDYWELSGDSYVERAKNTIVNKFLEDPDNTHLFMIDSDMQWNPEAFVKMCLLQEEIVIGSYPTKNKWEVFCSSPLLKEDKDGGSYTVGRKLEDGSALLVGGNLAGGFMRFKRAALEKFRDHYPELRYTDVGADPDAPNRVYTEFFACEKFKGVRWGEDRVFSRRLADMGMRWWIYTNIDFHHYGIKGWGGNFDQYLKKQHEVATVGGVMPRVDPSIERVS